MARMDPLILEELLEQVRIGCFDHLARGDVYLKNGITGLMRAFSFCATRYMQTRTTSLIGVT
jgi:hypothetical protein